MLPFFVSCGRCRLGQQRPAVGQAAAACPPRRYEGEVTLNIWTGQFNIVEGVTVEDGPYVGIFEGTDGADGVGVYAVAEPIGGTSPELCDEVLAVFAAAFGRPEPALTANLLRAVAAAHQHVKDWNRRHGRDRYAGVAMSCLATRGNEAYLAQCGAALALAHTGGRFRVAAPAGDDSRRPLGLGERAAPVFTRFTLHPGDVLILAWSAADQMIDRGTLSSLVHAPPEEAMPALYVRVRQSGSFGALYLTAIEPDPAALADGATEVVGYGASRPAPAANGKHEGVILPAPTAYRPPNKAGDSPARPRETGYDAAPPDAALSREPSPRPRSAPRIDLGALGGGPRLPSRRFLLVGAAIVATVVFLLLIVPALARRGNDDRYRELLRSADASVNAAKTEPDAVSRRELLTRAEADLLEARTLQPNAGDLVDRMAEVSAALSALDGTRELKDFTQLADLSTLGIAPQSPVELAVAGRAYLLDSGTGKVFAFAAPGARPETIFEEGRAVGAERTAKPRHLAVAPGMAGKAAVLLVLDANRRLFALEGGAWRAVPLEGADAWKSDTALAVTASALYVLDTAGEQVWRHLGTPDGYDNNPEPLVSRAALRDGVALSISGVPIIATGDSRLLRLVDGKDEELKPSALDRPLKAPSAPVFNTADTMLYVADRGNQRFVVLDAAGNFQGQLTSRRLTALRAFALDEAHGVLYIVSGQALHSAPLPK
jgi:hypothetical protein